MKKRILPALLALILALGALSPALAKGMVPDGAYWKELTWDEGAAFVEQLKTDSNASAILFLYSHNCTYSQTWIPQFREYAEAHQIPLFGLDDTLYSGETSEHNSIEFGTTISGGYPVALLYHGDGREAVSSVRSMEAFEAVLNRTAQTSGDFVLNQENRLLRYLGVGGDVVIPDGVLSIDPSAFDGCDTVRSLVVPEGVTELEARVFQGCGNLEEITLPSTVTKLGPGVFSANQTLRRVDMGASGITELPPRCLSNNYALKELVLPHGLVSIGDWAINNTTLPELVIPASVTTLGKNALGQNFKLQTLRFLGHKPQMATGEDDSLARSRGAAIYPADDPTWGSVETLLAEHPSLNWGGLPGQITPLPARSELDDGTLADWAADEVALAASYELTAPADRQSYGQPITRVNFSQLMMRVVEKVTKQTVREIWNSDKGDVPPFSDVSNIYTFAAAKLGLVSGRGDGCFDPEGAITRQEAAVMLARTAQYLGAAGAGAQQDFADRGDVAPWALESVDLVSGLTTPEGRAVMGSTGSGFSPLATYSNQEAQCSFLRLYQAVTALDS